VDRDTYELLDYTVYRLNITKANKENDTTWAPAYSFRSFYGKEDMSAKSYAQLIQELKVTS
jgi:hypothetical protein